METSNIANSIKSCLKPENVRTCSRPYVRIANGSFAGGFFGMIYGIIFGTVYALVGSIIFSLSFEAFSDLSLFWMQSQRVVVFAMMLGALVCGVLGGISSMRKTSQGV